jgi:hypothetical protein
MSEWHITALFTSSIWLAIKYDVVQKSNFKDNSLNDKSINPIKIHIIWLICGFLGGAGVGLKLTGEIYAISLALMCLFTSGSFTCRIKYVVFLAFGGLIGFAITFSYWGLEMWSRFGNPLFPLFNNIFKSPMASLHSYADTRFAVKSIWELVSLPYRLMSENFFVSEMSLRYDRTPADLEKFAIKLQRLAIDMKRIVVQAEMERIAMQPKAEKVA